MWYKPIDLLNRLCYNNKDASCHCVQISERQALCDWGLRTMSGGEPSSIKQFFRCDTVSLSFTYLYG